MFALHETTQRRVCRVAFLLVCVLPTLLTVGWIAHWYRPWHQSDWQQTLAQRLHIRASLDEISSPRPGVRVLSNLRLAELRTGRALGVIDKVDLRQQAGRQLLRCGQITLPSEQLGNFANAIATWLSTEETTAVEIHALQLTITSPTWQAVQLKNLTIVSDFTEADELRFRVKALNDAGEAVQMVVKQAPESLHLTLDTQQAPLPSWLLGTFVPGVGGCGEASFTGLLAAAIDENQQSHGKLRGQFDQVNLETWLGTDGPHRLQGSVQLQFDQFTWQDKAIQSMQGTVEAERGTCSYSLLQNAVDRRLLAGPALGNLQEVTPEQLVPFDQLSLHFQISSQGLSLNGSCEANGSADQTGLTMLMGTPAYRLLQVSEFVQLFEYRLPMSWFPATRRAHSMAEKLPLPDLGTNSQ